MSRQNPDQYVLPFDAARDEMLAQVRMLRNVDMRLTAGRQEGIIQLLERLILLGNDLSERDGRVIVRAQLVAIAARVQGRRTAGERTVRNWRRDAEAMGVLETDFRSQRYGGTSWNIYTLRLDQIRHLVLGGNGRQRAATNSAPRAATNSAPRAATNSAPYHCIKQCHSPPSTDTQSTPGNSTSAGRPPLTVGAVVSVFLELGVARAATLVPEALSRGCDTRSLMAIARWFQRSQRRHPTRWRKPATVLMVRLTAAWPGVGAWKGWIDGEPYRRPRRQSTEADRQDFQRRRLLARQVASMEPSMAEMLRAGKDAKLNHHPADTQPDPEQLHECQAARSQR